MKYLKSIFESNQLNGITQKSLINANLTKDQYMDMIDFVGRCGYSEVKESLPFLLKMIEDDNYDISELDLSMLIRFYKLKKAKVEDLESVEDFFLDIIEDKSNDIRVDVPKDDNVIGIRIYFTDFGDLSIKLGDIDRRFKRSGKKYDMTSMESLGSGTASGRKCIYLKIEI